MKKRIFHKSVLLQEVTAFLAPQDGDVIVDATLGGGGHAIELSGSAPGIKIIGFETDPDTALIAQENLRKAGAQAEVINENFRKIEEVLRERGVVPDKILLDLGLSEFSLFSSGRGFSFQEDELLDMRFNPEVQKLTASDIVNEWSEKDLQNILRAYGNETKANKIAHAIVTERRKEPITTTARLREIIESAVRKRGRINPATRTFQALRITVNDELDALSEALEGSWEVLKTSGRIAVISFHSAEDKIVKNFFKDKSKAGIGEILTKKPITPGKEELLDNPKARSAKLRAATKLS